MGNRERLTARARKLPPIVPQVGVRALRAAAVPSGFARYLRDRRRYAHIAGAERLRWIDSFPQLADRTATSPFDSHYFYQDVWAARHVASFAPRTHVDIGSRVDYVGFLTAICEVEFVDIRPLTADLDRLRPVEGSATALPYGDRSLASVSCLHVAEHIGLGRYGDPLDPGGTRRAASELQRVLAPGAQLLFSLPVGTPRVCFNAHRVHDPREVLAMFGELELAEFCGVDDDGRFRHGIGVDQLKGSHYACGMYRFIRVASA